MSRRPGSGVQAYRRRAADTERMVDAATAALKAERSIAWKANEARADAERERIRNLAPIARHRIVPGVIVGDRKGRVGRVIRVNPTTVTVQAGVDEFRLVLDDLIAITGEATT